ncbi:S1C family serine protease [Aeoliella sp. ICT_H6.2]|uniref:S1C family serine protease n=1 Tax=Aeoliella straminimaris TaxID=2954799 RepID=A0A9X2FFN3_9BACT|nr:S1C family serine protease [Aeoliella straminimaris]MCO6047919.1 S1C family serine protease [Aeoliella straminimaris]
MNKWLLALAVGSFLCVTNMTHAQKAVDLVSFGDVNRYAQERSVKIYGVGGLRQLEAYQSGVLVSAEGYIATVASLVLDEDTVTVLLNNGQRLEASVVGTDPLLDVAVLKLDTEETDFPYFDLTAEQSPYEGMRVLAYSNLYNVATGDEPVSVLHGVLSVIAPLEARRGSFSSRYRGDVYIVDAATNNPGAAGGVLLDTSGQPLGMLGKELKSELTGTWLNYAMPWEQVSQSVDRILSGDLGSAIVDLDQLPENPATFAGLGFRLVPSVVARTPPYIDTVLPGSPAASAGLMPDDLIIALAGMRTGTHVDVEKALMQVPGDQPVRLTVLRGNMLVEVELVPMNLP